MSRLLPRLSSSINCIRLLLLVTVTSTVLFFILFGLMRDLRCPPRDDTILQNPDSISFLLSFSFFFVRFLQRIAVKKNVIFISNPVVYVLCSTTAVTTQYTHLHLSTYTFKSFKSDPAASHPSLRKLSCIIPTVATYKAGIASID